MSDIPVQSKRNIIETTLAQINNTIYDAVIKKRVADKVGDKALGESAVQQAEKYEKMKDEYEIILKELDE